MKFIRFAIDEHGSINPGVIDEEKNIRDLSSFIQDILPEQMIENSWFQEMDVESLPFVNHISKVYIHPCVMPKKFIGIAFNSIAHAKQLKQISYDEPIFFFKSPTAITGAHHPIIYPKVAKKVDWEAELGVVIGKRGKYISKEQALNYVFGYCCSNDLSDRFWQFDHPGNQHTKAKSFDTFAPIGPYIVTKDEIANPNNLQITLKVNGVLRQQFSTSEYKFSVEEVISFLSQLFPLEPGDIISMGSGPGTAEKWNGAYLQIGDEVELEIEHLGKQQQVVIKEE